MRYPRWTWPAAMAAMGLAASSPWIDAQSYRGLEPGAIPNPNASSADNLRITPQSKVAEPVINPAEAAMLRSRSARTVLRNGLDYIKYQQFEKALTYLREAEKRSKELGPQDLISLRQGIEAAQDGLRTPSAQIGYARTRKPNPGSIAIASRRNQEALTDSSMRQASAEKVQTAEPRISDSNRNIAGLNGTDSHDVQGLAPISPEVMARELPSVAEIAKSQTLDSAHRQYANAGSVATNYPAVKAPTGLEPATRNPATISGPVTSESEKSQPQETEISTLPPLQPTLGKETGRSDVADLKMPEAVPALDDLAAPTPLPGSPLALSSANTLRDGNPPRDSSISEVNSQSLHQTVDQPQITEVKTPQHLEESSTLPDLPPLEQVQVQIPALPELPEVSSEGNISGNGTIAKSDSDSSADSKPLEMASQAQSIEIPALISEPENENIPPAVSEPQLPIVPAPDLPRMVEDESSKVVSDSEMPELPGLTIADEVAAKSGESTTPELNEVVEIKETSARQTLSEPMGSTAIPSLENSQEKMGVEKELPPLPVSDSKNLNSEMPDLPPLPAELVNAKSSEIDGELPPLPAEAMTPVSETDLRTVAALSPEEVAPAPTRAESEKVGGIPVLTPLADDEELGGNSNSGSLKPASRAEKSLDDESLPPLPTIGQEAITLKTDSPTQESGVPEAELPALPASVDQSATPSTLSDENSSEKMPAGLAPSDTEQVLPPLPTVDTAAATPSDTQSQSSGLPESKESAEPVMPENSLPPLPVAESALPDTPPLPPAMPNAEPTVDRLAQATPVASGSNNADQGLPPLPAEEIASPSLLTGSNSVTGSTESATLSDRILSSLTPESRRDIEKLARMQIERPGGSTPGLSPLGNLPAAEPADIVNRSMLPGSFNSLGSTLDDPLVRLELPRAPSPAEARPIRAILLPENFDNLKKREFDPRRKMWASAAVAHYPLYFQNPTLERYGISFEQRMGPAGRKLTYPVDDPKQSKQRNQIATPFFSVGLFATQIATWPLRMVADPPWEAEYDLGYYRPGDRVPEDTVVFPWKGVGPLFKGNNY